VDGEHFDAIARLLAAGHTRRAALRAAAGGLTGIALALLGRGAAAKPNPKPCRSEGRNCSKDDQCCSGYCRGQRGRQMCAACASDIVCGDTCCPDNAVNGCTAQGGCLCPEGTRYNAAANACQPCGGADTKCTGGDDCCGDSCCGGTCCAEGDECCGRICGSGVCCGDRFCGDGEICCGDECCPVGGSHTCREGKCIDCQVCRPGLGCCSPFGRRCSDAQPCCSGVCERGTCRCAGLGETCDEPYDCCEGTSCIDRVCQRGNNDGTCRTDADCGPAYFCDDGACTFCESGDAWSSSGIEVRDCPWSMRAYICYSESAGDPAAFGYCCISGENCPDDPCGAPCPFPLHGAVSGGVTCPGG
jgi:hypothetical protein